MTLYTCQSCGSVRTDDQQCYVCGGDAFDTYEVEAPEPTYACDECGESFSSSAGLASHSRVHKGEDDEDE